MSLVLIQWLPSFLPHSRSHSQTLSFFVFVFFLSFFLPFLLSSFALALFIASFLLFLPLTPFFGCCYRPMILLFDSLGSRRPAVSGRLMKYVFQQVSFVVVVVIGRKGRLVQGMAVDLRLSLDTCPSFTSTSTQNCQNGSSSCRTLKSRSVIMPKALYLLLTPCLVVFSFPHFSASLMLSLFFSLSRPSRS